MGFLYVIIELLIIFSPLLVFVYFFVESLTKYIKTKQSLTSVIIFGVIIVFCIYAYIALYIGLTNSIAHMMV